MWKNKCFKKAGSNVEKYLPLQAPAKLIQISARLVKLRESSFTFRWTKAVTDPDIGWLKRNHQEGQRERKVSLQLLAFQRTRVRCKLLRTFFSNQSKRIEIHFDNLRNNWFFFSNENWFPINKSHFNGPFESNKILCFCWCCAKTKKL